MRRARLFAVVIIAVLWTAALLAAPSAEAPRFSALVYAAGSLVCHQIPERSFHRGDAQYPVCARCLGLYIGGFAGVLGWVAFSGSGATPRARAIRVSASPGWRRVLIVTAAPTVFSLLTAAAGWWDPGNSVRAVLALPLGASIAALVAAVAAKDLR